MKKQPVDYPVRKNKLKDLEELRFYAYLLSITAFVGGLVIGFLLGAM